MVKYLVQKHYEVKELKMLLDAGVDNAVAANDYISFGSEQQSGTLDSDLPQ